MTDVVLIGGLWLQPAVWAQTQQHLGAAGHRPTAVALPVEPDTTLDDQLAEVLRVIAAAGAPPLVVGHSAAASLAWLAADRVPVAGVVFVGGFPQPDGQPYADFLPDTAGPAPFPGWEMFDGPDSADLDETTRAGMQAAMVPVPPAVAKDIVRLHDPGRYEVPVTLICPEFSPDEARAWLDAGDLPELAAVQHLRLVDLDSGHWPMISRPQQLAALIAEAAAAG